MYMKSTNAVRGLSHCINRSKVYEDVLDLYRKGTIVEECPICIEFKGEIAVDSGGVQRDMFSAFRERAYSMLFEGATLLTPMIHPQMDMTLFPIVGRILSHGYLVSGVLPIRIALPTLMCMLLGQSTPISPEVLLDTFLDFISISERDIFKSALAHDNAAAFPCKLQTELMTTLGGFGCRQLPTPSNLMNLIEQIARYEFLVKPAAGIAMINSGIPMSHRKFWNDKSPTELLATYQRLTLNPVKVKSLFSFPDFCSQSEVRIAGYLRTMIGNMQPDQLRLFICLYRELRMYHTRNQGDIQCSLWFG